MNNLYQKIQKRAFCISGPCVIEDENMAIDLAGKLQKICNSLEITLIFKASFDKANRTSINSFRGLGIDKGLRVLQKIKEIYQLPIVTDIHETSQVKEVSEVVDVIQIPAFLCRQTDLLIASAQTGKIINIKKGQFLSGKDMKFACEKVLSVGNESIILTERGNTFGYNNLVVDFKNLVDMENLNFPVAFDATHSCKDKNYVLPFTKAAAGMGIKGFFFEVHQNPALALSDSDSMISIDEFTKCAQSISNFSNGIIFN
ncbi:MAG: 3-deoxy-8-phosphooctulonate synthase [Calditrichaeota bacterium]|nr:MAG: 3-deoxy-8-phosphooctulonate synthase [Calditrichota bacterium]